MLDIDLHGSTTFIRFPTIYVKRRKPVSDTDTDTGTCTCTDTDTDAETETETETETDTEIDTYIRSLARNHAQEI